MIGLNDELAARQAQGKPVRIGLIGAGHMGADLTAQVAQMKGVEVCSVADIDLNRAWDAYRIAGTSGEIIEANTAANADAAVAAGKRVVVSDYRIVSAMKTIEVMLESTGIPEIGACATLISARNGQYIAMMNVETDVTVGPILNWYAKQKGSLYALAAGDEPAACKELYDFADSLGFTIVAAGKGKNNPLDRRAQPADEFWIKEAERRGLTPRMLVEFVDGSKTTIEMASLSNASGLVPDIRGMHGPITSREKLNETFALAKDGGVLQKLGVVDYALGDVAPGVFVIVATDQPRLREALVLRDMGNGPYYTIFRPYHLCSIEAPLTCAMLAIRKQSNMVPLNRLVSEVFAVAKRDLHPGDTLDGIGGATFYCLIDRYETARAERLLPAGLAKGARMIRPKAMDEPITYEDIELYEPSSVLKLRRLQDHWMAGTINERELIQSIDRIGEY